MRAPMARSLELPRSVSNTLPILSRDETDALRAEIGRLSRAWLSQIGQMQQFDTQFADKLAACTNAAEAAELCGKWMSHRVDSAVAMQHRLLEAWLETMGKAALRGAAERQENW